jgi:hypothetical protein
MWWKRSTATSKQDHGVDVRHALSPEAMLWVQAGAGNSNEVRGGRRWLGKSWRGRRRAARKGNRTGAGGEGRVEVDPAGGGAAAAAERRPGAKHCAGGRGNRAEHHVLEEEEEGRGVRGACLKISEISGTSW